jgi:hypothetical protein
LTFNIGTGEADVGLDEFLALGEDGGEIQAI